MEYLWSNGRGMERFSTKRAEEGLVVTPFSANAQIKAYDFEGIFTVGTNLDELGKKWLLVYIGFECPGFHGTSSGILHGSKGGLVGEDFVFILQRKSQSQDDFPFGLHHLFS